MEVRGVCGEKRRGGMSSIDQSINQLINQREICRTPLYDTSSSANSSQL